MRAPWELEWLGNKLASDPRVWKCPRKTLRVHCLRDQQDVLCLSVCGLSVIYQSFIYHISFSISTPVLSYHLSLWLVKGIGSCKCGWLQVWDLQGRLQTRKGDAAAGAPVPPAGRILSSLGKVNLLWRVLTDWKRPVGEATNFFPLPILDPLHGALQIRLIKGRLTRTKQTEVYNVYYAYTWRILIWVTNSRGG